MSRINIKRMNLIITKKCNLKCRICDIPRLSSKVNEMEYQEIIRLIDDAVDLGLQQLELSGGEPLCRPDLIDIMKYASGKKVDVILITNGTMINKEKAEQLVEFGLKSVMVSIDGFEEVNDRIRGKGTYTRAVGAIESFLPLRERMHDIGIGVTLTKINYLSVLPFLEYMFDKYNPESITINPFSPNFLSGDNQQAVEEFGFTDRDFVEMEKEILKIIEFQKKVTAAKKWMSSERFLKKIPDFFHGKYPKPIDGCFEPLQSCAVDTEGWVIPCWGDPVWKWSIRNKAFKDIILSDEYNQFVEKNLFKNCKGCLSSCYYDLYDKE